MKRITLLILVIAAFSFITKAQTVFDFTLVNETGEDLYGMFVSEVSTEKWSQDIIPTDILPEGHEVDVKFTYQGEAGCNWDIKLAKDAEGNAVTISNVNLCDITKITLKKEDGKYVCKTE